MNNAAVLGIITVANDCYMEGNMKLDMFVRYLERMPGTEERYIASRLDELLGGRYVEPIPDETYFALDKYIELVQGSDNTNNDIKDHTIVDAVCSYFTENELNTANELAEKIKMRWEKDRINESELLGDSDGMLSL